MIQLQRLPDTFQTLLLGCLLLVIGGPLTSCESTHRVPVRVSSMESGSDSGEPKAGDPAESEESEDKDEDGESPLDKAKESQVKATQARTYSETELELARLDERAGEIEVAESLRSKRAALKAAREDLAVFEESEQPKEMREADLSLERQLDRLLKAETDLVNMREIMSEEAEAKNKDEIIRRYEKSFEFAKETVAIQELERNVLLTSTLPTRMRKLAGAVREAEADLQVAEIKAEKSRRSAQLDILKAQHEHDEARRAAKKAAGKVKALEAKGQDS